MNLDIKDLYYKHFVEIKTINEISRIYKISKFIIKKELIQNGFNPLSLEEQSYRKIKNNLSKEKLYNLHIEKKISLNQIHKQYNVQEKYLEQLFNEYQIPIQKHLAKQCSEFYSLDINKIIEMNGIQYMTARRIAISLGILDSTLRTFCKLHKIKLFTQEQLFDKKNSEILSIEEIRELCKTKFIGEISKEYSISMDYLRKIIKKYNIKTNTKQIIIDNECLTSAYKRLKSSRSVADELGICQYTAFKRLKDFGIQLEHGDSKINILWEEHKDSIIERNKEPGMTLPKLSKEFGIVASTIRKRFDNLGIDSKNYIPPNELWWIKNGRKVIDVYTNLNISLIELSEMFDMHPDWLSIKLRKDGIDIKYVTKITSGVRRISEFLHQHNINYILNYRKEIYPFEIDIFLPAFRFGIEYHGLYWHREEIKGKSNCIDKYNKCKENGIELIQIFDDEFLDHSEIILRNLERYINNGKIKISDCEIIEIDELTRREFLNKNDILGDCKSEYSFGIIFQNKLICVACFNKNGRDIKIERFTYIENVEYCVKVLIEKYFSNKKIIVHEDLRWKALNKDLFIKNGFKQIKILPPKYKYTNNFIKRLHKSELIENKRYHKIWDCGEITYEKE